MELTGYTDFDANLWEIVYEGVYNGNKIHWIDYDRAINRAFDHGVEKIIIQADDLKPCRRALEIAREFNHDPGRVFSTTGLMCSYQQEYIDLLGPKEKYRPYLENILFKNPRYVVSIGKTGLRFTKDCLEACSKEKQIKYLVWFCPLSKLGEKLGESTILLYVNMQLEMAQDVGLPIVMHCKGSAKETAECLAPFEGKVTPVLAGFTGTIQEAEEYMKLGAYIGISGCSLKTPKNVKVVKSLPSDRILFGTDCPYCKLKRTSPAYQYVKTKIRAENRNFWSPSAPVKGRTEPVHVIQLVEATAGIRGVESSVMLEESRKNFYDVFFPQKQPSEKQTGTK